MMCKNSIKKLKMLLKDVTGDLTTWKDIPCSWIGRLAIIRVLTLPELIHTFKVILKNDLGETDSKVHAKKVNMQ